MRKLTVGVQHSIKPQAKWQAVELVKQGKGQAQAWSRRTNTVRGSNRTLTRTDGSLLCQFCFR